MVHEVLADADQAYILYTLTTQITATNNTNDTNALADGPLFGTLDLKTGAVEEIGRVNGVIGLNNLSMTAQGTVYAFSPKDESLYEIDMSTGAPTLVFRTQARAINEIAHAFVEQISFPTSASRWQQY